MFRHGDSQHSEAQRAGPERAVKSEAGHQSLPFAFQGAGNVTTNYHYGEGQEIYGEDEPAKYIYRVTKGAVRACKRLLDGRRQIAAFYLPGDIFGIEPGATHLMTAEAVIDTSVQLANWTSVHRASQTDVQVALELWTLASSNLKHAEDHMLLLGRKTSMERVAAFLLEMDGRLAGRELHTLPMSRLDIADYLGLRLETVSRVLGLLQREGILKCVGPRQRAIMLKDRARLREFEQESSADWGRDGNMQPARPRDT